MLIGHGGDPNKANCMLGANKKIITSKKKHQYKYMV